jgi:hypothetical protein
MTPDRADGDSPAVSTREESEMDTRNESTLIAPGSRLELVVCSLCLRVLRDAGWVAASEVIRELRTYDEPEAPLHAAVCDGCEGNARMRRAKGSAAELERLAA